MLDLRWACVVLVGCTSASDAIPIDGERDERTIDARVLDARVLDARVSDAKFEPAKNDAAKREDAATADAGEVLRSWMNVPMGPPTTPREVCSREWEIPNFGVINGFGSVPIARFHDLMIDAAGETIVSGTLQGQFDFGAGELKVPGSGLPMATFLLKLDSECNLLWSRVFTPAAEQNSRAPAALGLDAHGQTVLVTGSSNSDARYSAEVFTLDERGAVLAQYAIALGSSPLGPVSASRDGRVLISGVANATPIDFGAGPISDPEERQRFNVLFDASGKLLRQDLLGGSPQTAAVRQQLGSGNELIAWGRDVADYYGVAFAGSTIAKLTASRTLAWKSELYPREPITLDDLRQDVREDGTIAIWMRHGYDKEPGAEQRIRELAPDGRMRWDVPITWHDSLLIDEVDMGPASVAARATLRGYALVGNSQLFGAGARPVLLQFERGGALRWALTLHEAESIQAVEVDARDRVVMTGTAPAVEGTQTFVRVYAQE